jgi:hypothetical protein
MINGGQATKRRECKVRRVGSVAVVLVFAVVLSLAAAAAGNAASQGRAVTFHLVEKSLGFNFIDNPPRQGFRTAPLIGDQFALTSELLTRSGRHAGHLEAVCTVTRGGDRGYATCSGTFFLKGGHIALLAGLNLASEGSDHIAVVGGTGVYEGVTGSITSASRGSNSPFSDDTIHLIFP